jgi:acyl-coenzyme A thioesterase PaaI-like protein
MNTPLQDRIANSFAAQGLMSTLGAELVFVGEGEEHIALPFAKHLSQQHGYVHAAADTYKVVALMQATIVNLAW